MGPRVFITQRSGGIDTSSAEDYGKVITIWPPNAQAWGEDTHIVASARRALADFDSELDFLLPLGDPALFCIASAEIALVTGGVFRILKWDRRKPGTEFGGYRVVEVDLS